MNTEAIDNLIARMQRAEQECDALRETVLSIGAQRDELRAKLDASERAASEMREALQYARHWAGWLCNSAEYPTAPRGANLMSGYEPIDRALSSDAGRDYVHRSEVAEAWRKGMTDAANISGSGGCLCPEDILSARDAKTSTT